jgi:hypothetical protein
VKKTLIHSFLGYLSPAQFEAMINAEFVY